MKWRTARCPLWVINGYRDTSARSLLHPCEQTLAFVASMSVQCQQRKSCRRHGDQRQPAVRKNRAGPLKPLVSAAWRIVRSSPLGTAFSPLLQDPHRARLDATVTLVFGRVVSAHLYSRDIGRIEPGRAPRRGQRASQGATFASGADAATMSRVESGSPR
jgi:hypothetical protein